MNPSTWLSATEQPSGIDMQRLCIEAMQLLTENMSVDELGAEIRRLTPLIRGLVPHVQTAVSDEDLRAAVHLKVATEWNELSEAAVSDVTTPKVTRFVRNLYTNWAWPSPLPRLMALELRLTTDKRIRHVEAISLLAQRLRCTPFEFISKDRREVAEILFPVSYWGDGKKFGVRRILYGYL
jgi:hypothetical protein